MKLPKQIGWMVLVLSPLPLWGCTPTDGDAVAESGRQSKSRQPDGNTNKPNTNKKHKHANRLARESSPYLLLHAHNPVDWYPWGPEAFATAKKEKKPIFLSVGYSSCYWCHVMERLVFTNKQIAAYMNEHFVNIKVDREERPDVDDIYMTSLYVYFQAVGSRQGGGWPLSMFLTSEGKPFAGGTYFPPKDANGRPGFDTVLRRVTELWENQRKNVEQNAETITAGVRTALKPGLVLKPVKIDRGLTEQAVRALVGSYDSQYGGIDFNRSNPNGPKFPSPAKLALLQYAVRRHGNMQAEKILNHTLDQIAAGGIQDHLGGGFHRYSTDRFWHVPHFEKMLYDQAQLADVYAEAFRRTGKRRYRKAAEGIFAFMRREMTDPKGGFYSALDAETDGIEGKFYVWSKPDIEKLLGSGDAKLFRLVYSLEDPKTFEHGYVLHLPKPVPDVAATLDVSAQELQQRLTAMRQTLLAARSKRKPLLRDDKILASWNGLMIRAYAHAGMVFEVKEYVAAAEKGAMFVLSEMRDDQNRLQRTYLGGQAKLNAYVDDYAFLVEGLLALHGATGDEKWLNAARRLTDQQIEQFWDKTGKGFFFTPHHHEVLIARTKNSNDSAIPAGNSVSVRNLIRLASLTGEKKYRQYAEETLQIFAPAVMRSPGALATLALAAGEFLDNPDFGPASKK